MSRHCLRVAPCREPNDKLSLVALERFTTLACVIHEATGKIGYLFLSIDSKILQAKTYTRTVIFLGKTGK